MSLRDQDGSDSLGASKAQGLLPVSMHDQSTLAITISLIVIFGMPCFLVSSIWQHDSEQHDTASPLVNEFQADINSADWPEIAALPDIGPTRARQIVWWRETQGPFASLDDLAKIPGIGPATIKSIGPYLRWNGQTPRHVVSKIPLLVDNPELDHVAK